MLEEVPWFVGGGAEHSPEVARVLAYAATSGSRGVIGAGDLQVRALNVPGAFVRVAPGVGVMPNQYPGAILQSYIGRNASETLVPVPATGSSGGAAYLVILKVKDPQYPGTPIPPDMTTADFLDLVLVACSATATKIIGAAYPHVVLARLNIPANTATILQSMITPLREMAMPRRKRDLSTSANVAQEVQTFTGETGEVWPNGAAGNKTVEIPDWATRMRAVVQWAQVYIPPGNARGYLWLHVGTTGAVDEFDCASVQYDTPGGTSVSRTTFVLGVDAAIPSTMRGTVQPIYPKAKVVTKSSDAARISMDAWSAMVIDIEFLEAPTEDDF